ncbi:MAG: ferrous iron transport protein B [Bacillaceae bacterium]
MKTVALLGNPNTGKTSLFNTLTNSYAYVGNWSGVTVEKKVGTLVNKDGKIIDLPGIYDITPLSKEENIVTNFLIHDEYNTILNILDASLLSRNLQLTIQLLELGKPMTIALNMMDVAKRRGLSIDTDKLSNLLHVPVIPVIARTGKGTDKLIESFDQPIPTHSFSLDYGIEMEDCIEDICDILSNEYDSLSRWIAIQVLLENNAIIKELEEKEYYTTILNFVRTLQDTMKKPLAQHIYATRQAYIDTVINECVTTNSSAQKNWSERLDKLFTHPFFGLPIFFFLMYLIFQTTFKWVGTPLSDMLDAFITGPFTTAVESLLQTVHASDTLQALILDGIISGVGGVLVFVPQIFVLFFFISLLEDSGYMSRIAIVMDRIMEFFGLNGKAFIPMIVSFGCNVPGIMTARTIEQEKDRLLTILVAPFMSCSARLPVYALFAGAFFAKNQSLVILSLYILGIVLALIVTKILSLTLLKKDKSIFIIELPPYRIPQGKTLWRSTWEKGKGFIRKAGTIIFAGSVLIWLLTYLGPGGINVDMNESFLAKIGGVIAPIFTPLGFGTWEASASLLTGFLAKEVVVSSMSIIYGVTEGALGTTIASAFTPLSAYAFLTFVLLYVPCLATVAVIRRETASLKWTIFSVIYPLVTAYVVALLVYTIGNILF